MGGTIQDPVVDANNGISNGIDQIREIIFGEQMAAWESRLAGLEAGLQDLTKRTESLLDEISKKVATDGGQSRKVLQAELKNTKAEIAAHLQEFRDELSGRIDVISEKKVDKDAIGEVFIQWGQKAMSNMAK